MNYDIFISYSRKDKKIVAPFINRIDQEVGTKCWIDMDGIESGEQFEDVIIRAIDNSRIVLFMLSDNSLNSKWIKREVYYAESKNKRIIPIVIDDKGLRGWFQFHFGSVDFIDIRFKDQCEKLFRDLNKWVSLNKQDINKTKYEPKQEHTNTNHTKQTIKVFEKYNKNTIFGITLILLGLIMAVFAVYMWTKEDTTAEQDIILEEVDTSKSTNINNNPSKPSEFNISTSNISNTTTQTSTGNISSSVPNGAINGKFSVSENKQVYFSKGNLQYKASTKTWRFAEHQWDYIGEGNNNISPTYDGWIDLFGWGTGDNPTETSADKTKYSSFVDWSINIFVEAFSWHTMTIDEWRFLLEKRNTMSGVRYVKAIVNGINGVILLPDNWNKSIYKLRKTNNEDASFKANNISLSDWTNKFENNGAIFIPAAGSRRFEVTTLKNDVKGYGYYGSYWSSTAGQNGYALYYGFSNDYFVFYSPNYRPKGYGCSVRLVCDIQ